MKRLFKGTGLFVLGSLLAAPAIAAQITILSAHGNWHDPTYSSNTSGVGSIVNGDPTSSINWGGSAAVSGYDFTKALPGSQTLPPAPTPLFPLGTFTHRNKDLTVNGNSFRTLQTVKLDVILTLSVDGTTVGPLTFTFNFTHDETSNTSTISQCDPAKLNPTSTYPCPDVVTFAASPTPTTFKVSGVDYTLAMSFVDSQGKPIARFITEELQDNVANLVGQFNTPAIGGGPNKPPTVNAGPDQNITLPALTTLSGTASDDGLPNNILTVAWTKVSGPGSVTFGNAQSLTTTAAFTATGTYVLRLTASDTLLSASDDITMNVNSGTTQPPPPILNSLTPNTTSAGSPAMTMTVNGSQFISGATVTWNGSNLNTQFVNASELLAVVPAANLLTPGSINVRVINPTNQFSGALPFTITPGSVGGNPPGISFTATPPAIISGNSSLLNWSITNATSAVINQGIGAVSPISGTRSVSPASTITYTLTACGNGCSTAQVTVTVSPQGGGGGNLPTITFTATPTTVVSGTNSTLHWTIVNATSAVINQGVGTISPVTGSSVVRPLTTLTYILTAWGNGGTATAQVTVIVTPTNGTASGNLDLSQAKAYPVPYKSRLNTSGGINFTGLSTGSRIRIFSTDGHLVQTLYADDHILWPVDNKNGEKVASGVYFYRIDNGGGQVKEGKLVIIQ